MRESRYRSIPWGAVNIGKLLTLCALIILSIIDLGFAVDMDESQGLYAVHIVTPIIKIITFITAGVFVYFHMKFGVQSSGMKFIFYFLLMVFAIPQYRSEIQRYSRREDRIGDSENMTWEDYQFVSYLIYFPLVVTIFLFSCFSDRKPEIRDYEEPKKPSPEIGASFLNRIMFEWFDVMVWRGYRKPIETDMLWDMNPSDLTKELSPEFDKYWDESVVKGRAKQEKEARKPNKKKKKDATSVNPKSTNGSILPAMVEAFGGPFWFSGFLKIFIDALSFASPLILK